MNMKTELETAMKESLRAGDTLRKNTLRLVLTSIKEAEVREQKELDDAAIVGILQKEVKSRQETMDEAEGAGREDLAQAARDEIAILQDYLPEQMSDEELERMVAAAIAESGASSPADMGKVMKGLLPQVQGRADGGKVSQMVRSKLQGS